MTNDERISAMDAYCQTEWVLNLNTERYEVDFFFDEEKSMARFITYDYEDDCVCEVVIPHDQWVQLNCGLALAYAYNCVLDKIEDCVLHLGGGKWEKSHFGIS